jgi:hypothetical protein
MSCFVVFMFYYYCVLLVVGNLISKVNNPSTDSPEPVPVPNSRAAHTSLPESPQGHKNLIILRH